MTIRRHSLATLAPLALLAFSGCFGSHGAPDGTTPPEPPTPEPPDADAGMEPAPAPDPAPILPTPTGCRASGPARGVSVSLEALGDEACEYGAHDGVVIYDMGFRSEVDGLDFLVDFCPDADADCRCAVTVEGVGTDILDDLGGATSSGLLHAELAPTGVVFESDDCPESCGDGLCDCIPNLLLAAVDGPLTAPPVETRAVTAALGDEVCRISDAECDFVMWALDMVVWSSGFPGAIGTSSLVEQGETVRDSGLSPGMSLRVLRSSDADCGGLPVREAAWVAWRSLPGV